MAMMETTLSFSEVPSPGLTETSRFDAGLALVAPGEVFRRPRDVLTHPTLTQAEKRAILASWASDACAVADAPGLRRLPGAIAEPASIDAVLAALTELDRTSSRMPGGLPPARPAPRRLHRLWNLHRFVRRKGPDDDDDPPPCPAAAAPYPLTPPSGTCAAIPA